ncbi:MAG: hypothetical protein IGS39_12800 [Calothrix sp. C42_A2020_038]|nr:hypothetical protein [Calothrix sp. C42_A2020_038]
MGHRLTPVSRSVAPIYANGKLVFTTPTSVSSDLNRKDYASNPDNHKRYVFRTDTDSEIDISGTPLNRVKLVQVMAPSSKPNSGYHLIKHFN